MATKVNFNGKLISLPGVYADTKSGITNPPADLDFGGVLVIDTTNTIYSGGAGVDGTHSSGQESLHSFDNIVSLRDYIRGGILWDLAPALFRPFGSGFPGISQLHYIRPFTTTAAEVSLVFENGTYKISTRHEGTCGNGVRVTGNLVNGFEVILEKGVIDPLKFRLRFKRGTFTGNDQNGRPYNSVSETDSIPTTIAVTPELSTHEELLKWFEKNFEFNNNFVLVQATGAAGSITSVDLTSLSVGTLFAGGTQTFSPENLQLALNAVKNLGYTHVFSTDYGANSLSLSNMSILLHLETEAKYQKYLIVAGYPDKDGFENSKTIAKTFNSERVIVVHGAIKETDNTIGLGFREKTALHKAAYVLGRTLGMQPQTPPTFKALGYAAEVHKMDDTELESALDSGLLTTHFDTELQSFIITQGVNTLQDNSEVINGSGQSHLWSLNRIEAQLNKEIEVNAKIQLLGNQSQGPNRNTLSKEVVEEWVKNYLKRKTAKQTEDNLIIGFRNVIATTKGDGIYVSYEFEPNLEINKMFVTGLIIDPNLL